MTIFPTRDAAVDVLNRLLETNRKGRVSDDWTYRVEAHGDPSGYAIVAYDEDGQYVGKL